MPVTEELAAAVRRTLRAYPKNLGVSCAADFQLPLPEESALVGRLPLTSQRLLIDTLRIQVDGDMAYGLVSLATRLAILSVRNGDPELLKKGLWGILVDDGLVDWRDILRALSVIDDCARRVGFPIEPFLRESAEFATEKRKHTILEGYLSRPSALRMPEIMGLKARGAASNLVYVPIA